MRFNPSLAGGFVLVSLFALGCGGTVETQGTGGATATTSNGTTSTSNATTSTGTGVHCGSGTACGPNEYCDYPDNLCGKGAMGACGVRPVGCPKNLEPTCGCDGTLHGNPCITNAEGVDLNDGGCGGGAAPPGTIPCGAHFCSAATSYCEAAFSDVGGQPSTYTCKPLPIGCNSATSDCTCFPQNTPCVQQCKIILGGGLGGFELDCPGG